MRSVTILMKIKGREIWASHGRLLVFMRRCLSFYVIKYLAIIALTLALQTVYDHSNRCLYGQNVFFFQPNIFCFSPKLSRYF